MAGDHVTIQQLKYIVSVVENGTITEAAKKLYISQPSLSNAIKDIEEEVGITIFIRSRAGIVVTPEGMEFVGYARQVLRQMELLEDKYISHTPGKIRFGVSSPQYVFSTNAFVDIVEEFGKERFEFILHETTVHQILDDVKNRFSDLGIIYVSRENEQAMRKTLEENKLSFYELFTVKPQVLRIHWQSKAACSLKNFNVIPELTLCRARKTMLIFLMSCMETFPMIRAYGLQIRGVW